VTGTRLGGYKIDSFALNQVGFRYPSGGAILENVSLELPMNAVLHVTGPTGHGQSTLLKVLALLVEPTAGTVSVNGMLATEMTFEEFLPWRLEIGYTFENGGLLANRTLEDNLSLPHLYHNFSEPDAIKKEIADIAKRFRFANMLDRRPAAVSGGLRKLITILRPVLLRPSFLVMDDPFSGLDPETAKELEKLVSELREKSEIETVYFTSRDEKWPMRLGADSLWVENGCVEIRSRKAEAG
jgi:phospholipid/cholesterol/gamma-HCH transport system ATP-binding protein